MQRASWLVALAVICAGVAHAETERERAEREIEQQMKQLVKPPPPPSVRVVWEGCDSDKVAIDNASFMLDDANLSYGELDDLAARAAQHQPLYDGPVDPGKHRLEVHLAVHRTKLSLFEGLRRTTFKVSSAIGIPGQPGLQVTLRIKLHYDENQTDPKKRLQLQTREEPRMVVAVDDAPVPPEPHVVIATAREEPAAPAPAAPSTPEPAPPPQPEHPKRRYAHHRKRRLRFASARAEQASAPLAAIMPRAASAPVAVEDAGPTPVIDAGAIDAGATDAGAPDAGAAAFARTEPDAGAPNRPFAATGSSGAAWAALAGVALLGLAAIGLRRRK